MFRWARVVAAVGVLLAATVLLTTGATPAGAQVPVAVTTYYPAAPVVTYFPERRGLLFPRIVYRPAITYAVPAAPVTTYYAPVAPVIAAPAAPVTTYYGPAPVTTYYPPAPVTTYYPPPPVVGWCP